MKNILFSGNEKVFDGILTCMLSIFKRSESKESYIFYIFTMNVSHICKDYVEISDIQISFLDKVAKNYNEKNKVIKMDVLNLYNKEFANCPNESAYCSPYTLLRLLADEVENIPDKILYLDVDILFNQDIELLYNADIDGYEYAAARDHYGKYLINHNYINAGVLLLNMKEIRRTGLFKKARILIKTKKLPFADQSAIYRSTKNKKMLPQRFNDQKFLHKKTVVRHFSKRLFYLPYPHTENIKQWNIDKVKKVFGYEEFNDIFDEYINLNEKYKEITRRS